VILYSIFEWKRICACFFFGLFLNVLPFGGLINWLNSRHMFVHVQSHDLEFQRHILWLPFRFNLVEVGHDWLYGKMID
jgi:hypothetical protein